MHSSSTTVAYTQRSTSLHANDRSQKHYGSVPQASKHKQDAVAGCTLHATATSNSIHSISRKNCPHPTHTFPAAKATLNHASHSNTPIKGMRATTAPSKITRGTRCHPTHSPPVEGFIARAQRIYTRVPGRSVPLVRECPPRHLQNHTGGQWGTHTGIR